MIKEIFYEFWEKSIPEVKPRDFNIDFLNVDLINDIVGIRRCGKTYLIFFFINYLLERKKAVKRQILYLNFENRKLYPLKGDYFNEIVNFIYSEKLLEEYEKIYLFLDEIQNIEGWEKWLSSIYDEFKGKIKIVISGSNASLLKKDYATLLTGRHLTINLYPLSFIEFLKFKDFVVKNKRVFVEKDLSLLQKYIEEYLRYGGFPEVVLSKLKDEILQQYFLDIVTRDIISREKIRKNASLIEEIGMYLISNTSRLFSFRKIANFFNSKGSKISVSTLQDYMSFFENTFLIIPVRIFSYKIKDQMQHPQKIYCIDTGMLNAIGNKFSPDWGRLYENAVAVELRRKKTDIYYWKDYQHNEVDFVVKDGSKITALIQVCYELNDENYKREIISLKKCCEELKCKNLILINKDIEKEFKEGNKTIKAIPLWKFLLKGSGLDK